MVKYRNGQKQVFVNGQFVGLIFTVYHDDIYSLHWSHSKTASKQSGTLIPNWTKEQDCIDDLIAVSEVE